MNIQNTDNGLTARLSIDELYDCYYNELVLCADTILNDMDAAEDCVQEMFVSLWEKGIDRRLDRKGVRAYLYTVVRNKAIRLCKEPVKTVGFPEVSELTGVWEEERSSRDQLIETVRKELDKLPSRSREVLECIHLKNMKYAEAAAALGISVATVKTLLVRSLKTLRKSISDSAYLFYFFLLRKKIL
ncbi:MAG: sigma-70 family RNA polymerase sigma factor [Odoribacter sp.]|nr:sigma-70 family RNA polymerase sigma factor [Odoribacter sp.]